VEATLESHEGDGMTAIVCRCVGGVESENSSGYRCEMMFKQGGAKKEGEGDGNKETASIISPFSTQLHCGW
jgi:hypothetical protein